MGALATVAGAGGAAALTLAASMLALQLSIGALNDAVDAPRDRLAKPLRPIPAGLVSRRAAILAATGIAALGLALAGAVRPEALLCAVVVLAIGFTYDLVLKPTPLSWIAFAVGIPFLPVFAWVGAGAPMPPAFALLLPAAALAGAVLAIGNTLVDVERDRSAGVLTLPVAIGATAAWRIHAVLAAALVGIAGGGAMAFAAGGPGLAIAALGGLLLLGGAGLIRAASATRRERAWEVECVATATLGLGWLLAVTAPA